MGNFENKEKEGNEVVKEINVPNADGSFTQTLERKNGKKTVLRIVGESREGYFAVFYPEGKKKCEGYFKDDKLNGFGRSWEKDNTIKDTAYAINDDWHNRDELRSKLAAILGIEENALDVAPLFQPPMPLEQYKAEMFEPIKVRDTLKPAAPAPENP